MSFLGQEEQVREYQERFKYVYAAVLIGLGALVIRLVDLQVLRGDRMRQYSEENRIKRVRIAAPRGMIFDRNRKLLIDNHPAFDLEVIPQYLSESRRTKEVIGILSKLIKMPEAELQGILDKAKGQQSYLPIKIKADLTRDQVAAIESWKIAMPGVQVTEEIKRTNVFGDVAAHLLGYIGEVSQTELPQLIKAGKTTYKLGDSIGKFGLEQRMEEKLRGLDGERLVEVDALGRTKLEKTRGRVLERLAEKTPNPGNNLILTIDQDLQLAAAKAFGEKSGSVVAIDPQTGQILAMLSRPAFDPTEFSRGIPAELWNRLLKNDNKPLRDKTIQDHYPPGSTFKVLTAIAALEEGVIDEHTRFPCSGSIRLGNRLYHCHQKKGHGQVNVVSAITQSCDIFFYRAAQRLKSVNDIAKWAGHMGMGRKTGINLAREVPGLLPTEEWKKKRFGEEWNAGETLSVAIGQSYVLTTALQLANVYASIGNGGTLYKPYIVREVESNDGQPQEQFQPAIADKATISPRTRELIMQGLWGVVNAPGGTALSQKLPGMDFVGKTGTVQVLRIAADKIYHKCDGMKYRERHHGVFAGFAPAKNPVIAVAVIAEHACSGSRGAAPIARAVVKTFLEKYYPELYGEKAVAARLKGQAPSMAPNFTPPPVATARSSDEDDEVTVNSDQGPGTLTDDSSDEAGGD